MAVKADGKKPNGNIADLGRLGSLKEGCAKQGDWHGKDTPGAFMPTYYTINFCKGDNTWRITYYLYFSHVSDPFICLVIIAYLHKDSGHRYDWEWVSVLWKQDQNGEDTWYRAALKTSFHKTPRMTNWGDIQNTINGYVISSNADIT